MSSTSPPHHVPGLLARLLPAFEQAVTTDGTGAEARGGGGGGAPAGGVSARKPPTDPTRPHAAPSSAKRTGSAMRQAAAPRRTRTAVPPSSSIASLFAQPAPSPAAKPPAMVSLRSPSVVQTTLWSPDGGASIAALSPSPPPRTPQRKLHFGNSTPASGGGGGGGPLRTPRSTPAVAPPRAPALHLSHPFLQRMRLFRCRAEWLAALRELPLFSSEEFEAWRGVFDLAIEWLRHEQRGKRQAMAAVAAGSVAETAGEQDDDMWDEEQPGSAAAAAAAAQSTTSLSSVPEPRVKNTGRGLEEYTALLLRLRGFPRTSLRGGPRDGGIDLLAAREVAAPTRQDMVAVQCKEYYHGDAAAGSFYHATVTAEEVRAFHSAIVGLEFFNLQRRDYDEMTRRKRIAAAATSTGGASDTTLPTTHPPDTVMDPLIADSAYMSAAYLVTSGSFAQQARDFIEAFNRNQRAKWPQGLIEAATVSAVSAEAEEEEKKDASSCTLVTCGGGSDGAPFRGQIHLVDGVAFAGWVREVETVDPRVLERGELTRACELLTQCQESMRNYYAMTRARAREQGVDTPILLTSSWPWQIAAVQVID